MMLLADENIPLKAIHLSRGIAKGGVSSGLQAVVGVRM